jgi:hypothetical protein
MNNLASCGAHGMTILQPFHFISFHYITLLRLLSGIDHENAIQPQQAVVGRRWDGNVKKLSWM